MSYKDTISPIGEVKRDVFVGQFAAGAPVFIPDINFLPVLYESGEALSQSVDIFSHAQSQLLVDETTFRRVDIAQRAPAAMGNPMIPMFEFDAPIFRFMNQGSRMLY